MSWLCISCYYRRQIKKYTYFLLFSVGSFIRLFKSSEMKMPNFTLMQNKWIFFFILFFNRDYKNIIWHSWPTCWGSRNFQSSHICWGRPYNMAFWASSYVAYCSKHRCHLKSGALNNKVSYESKIICITTNDFLR